MRGEGEGRLNNSHKVTGTTSFAGLRNYRNTALNLGFIKASLPLSKGMVKIKM